MVMLNKEILHLGMFGMFRAGGTTTLFKGEGTHIVLEDYVLLDSVPLSFKKMASP
jgi:hypothetical protein